MTNEILLQRFHSGALAEEERLQVERELLVDPEVLLDYLEIKRASERAAPVPSVPTPQLRARLMAQVPRRRTIFAWAAGVAAAALVGWWALAPLRTEAPAPSPTTRILFDSAAEPFSDSSVL